MIFLLFVGGLILWFSGYNYTKNSGKDQSNLPKPKKFVSPPKWLYYLCGAPVSAKYPGGVLPSNAFRVQVMGIMVGIYAGVLMLVPSKDLIYYGLGVTVLISYMTSYMVEKFFEVTE